MVDAIIAKKNLGTTINMAPLVIGVGPVSYTHLVEIITDNRLHEMFFGDYEGVKNIRQKPECPVYLLFEEPEKYVAKDGAETVSYTHLDVYKRQVY